MFQLHFPAAEATTNATDKDLGVLPEWDLSDLYARPDAPDLHDDLIWLEKECQSFAADYEGKLATLSATALLCAAPGKNKHSERADYVLCGAALLPAHHRW